MAKVGGDGSPEGCDKDGLGHTSNHFLLGRVTIVLL